MVMNGAHTEPAAPTTAIPLIPLPPGTWYT